jgi:hypothetical protein
VQKTQKVIDPAANADAVLSHSLTKQVDDFTAGKFDAFDQAHDHPHVGQHRRVGHARLVEHDPIQPQFKRRGQWLDGGIARRRPRCSAIGLRRRGRRGLAGLAPGVDSLLLRLPGRRPVVRGAPLGGTLLPMVLPATERTTQVPPACIAGMREEANPAVRAENCAPAKLGMGLQDRVQRGLILPYKRAGAIVLMPICAKRENLLDGYDKKARLSTIIFIVIYTPSSYLFDANASRGRARFFCALRTRICGDRPHKRSVTYRSPKPSSLPGQRRPAARQILKTTTWKKEALFFFPSSTAIYLSREEAI